jgi:hypothetical protein
MFDFVLWSFMIALTPMALALASKLLSAFEHLISFGPLHDHEEATRMRNLGSVNMITLSGSGSLPCGARR